MSSRLVGTRRGLLSRVIIGVAFATASTTSANLQIKTSDSSAVKIDWGDGTVDTVASGTTQSHTYATAFAGNVRVIPAGAAQITSFYSNTGAWSFDLSALPRSLTYFNCQGSNTVSGSIASLPSGLTTFVCYGANSTVSGSIASLPSGLTYFKCTGYNTVTITHGASLPETTMREILIQGTGLTATEVDDIIIAASGISTWTNEKLVQLAGLNAAPTSASASAITTLQGYGVTVTHN